MLEGDIVNYLRRTLNLIQQLRIILFKLGFSQDLPFNAAIESLRRSHVVTQLDEESDVDILPDNWFTGTDKDTFFTGREERNEFEDENNFFQNHEIKDENPSLPKLREKAYRSKHVKHTKKDQY